MLLTPRPRAARSPLSPPDSPGMLLQSRSRERAGARLRTTRLCQPSTRSGRLRRPRSRAARTEQAGGRCLRFPRPRMQPKAIPAWRNQQLKRSLGVGVAKGSAARKRGHVGCVTTQGERRQKPQRRGTRRVPGPDGPLPPVTRV